MAMASGEAEAPAWWRWLAVPVDWGEFSRPAPAGQYKAQAQHLGYGLLCAVLLLLLRVCLEFGLLRPLGRRLGLSDKKFSSSAGYAAKAKALEPHFRRGRRPDAEKLRELSQLSGFSEKSIDNWFRQRRNKDKPSILVRFSECTWYIVYYSALLAYGIAVQYRQPYFWDSEQLWSDWPQQYVSQEIFWYYMLQLGFYCSSLVTLAFDIRRKDFLEMTVHHLVTIVLIVISFALNFPRVGSLTLVLHDAVDPLLNLGKLGDYISSPLLRDGAFALFIVVWIITRLVLLPVRVVYSAYADSLRLLQVPICPPYYIIVGGLITLQLLHFVWTYYILCILGTMLWQGKNAADIRSDSEMEGEEDKKQQ